MPIAIVIGGSDGFDNSTLRLMTATYINGYRTVGICPTDFFDT